MFKSDIYTVGGAVQAGNGLYIPRRADDELLSLCRSGNFAYILTARQMGKSSLMVRTAERLAEENIRSVIIDLTQIGTQVTPEQWYLGLLAEIEDQLGLETDVVMWWQSQTELGITQRLTLFFEKVLLSEITDPIVIFVDEIDTTLSLSFTDDFYAAIRYFYNARGHMPAFRHLSFVLIGVAKPSDLIRDPQRTPFNIGEQVELADFSFNEAIPLAKGLGLASSETETILKRILKWTGGHPYLTQRLCRAIVEKKQLYWTESEIDLLVGNIFFGEKSEQDNNLQFVGDMLTKRASDPAGVLTTYKEVLRDYNRVQDEEQSLLKSHLKLSGIVCREHGALRVRNLIYKKVFNSKWIEDHLPETWVKHQYQRARRVSGGLLLLLFIVGSISAYAWNQRSIAIARAKELNDLLSVVEGERKKAEELADREKAARDEAEGERNEANKQKLIAIEEKQKTQQALDRELAAKKQVENQRQIALLRGNTDRLYREGVELLLNKEKGAVGKFEETLELYKDPRVKDKIGEASTYKNIGAAYASEINRAEALKNYNKALAAYKNIPGAPGLSGQASTFLSIGLLDPANTISGKDGVKNSFEEALKKYNEANDLSGQAKTFLAMANATVFTTEYTRKEPLSQPVEKKIKFLKQALEAYKRCGDQFGKITVLDQFGKMYQRLSYKKEAIEYYKELAEAYKQTKNSSARAETLRTIGDIYNEQKERDKAIDHLKQALQADQETNDKVRSLRTLNKLSETYSRLDDKQKAVESLETFLQTYKQELGEEGEANILGLIGKVYYDSGDKQMALSYFDKAFQLNQNNLKKANTSEAGLFFARLNNELGDKQKAYDIYSKLFDFYQKAGDTGQAARMLAMMGEISYSTGKKQQAIEHFERLLEMRQQNRKVREKISLDYLVPTLESIYSEVGKPQNKVELLDKVPADYRGDKKLWQLEVFLTRGSISLGSGDKQSASNYIDQALQIVQNDPKCSQNINLLMRLVYFYRSLDNRQKTLELAEKSFSILSNFSRIETDRFGRYDLLNIAEIFSELGERQKASEAYQLFEITPEYITYPLMEDYIDNRP